MEKATIVLITLIIYKIILIAIGILSNRRTNDEADFFLGGRQLGPWVAAISASASSSSAWTLLGVSGFAYRSGLSALWLFPACVGGFLLNWYVLAPGLRRLSEREGFLTVTNVLSEEDKHGFGRYTAIFASLIILFSLMIYVASQFQGSGKTFESAFEMNRQAAILIGCAIIIFYTLLGGFWAVSLTDTLQGIVMAATAILLPVAALMAVGGFGGLAEGIRAVQDPSFTSLTKGLPGSAGFGFVLGLLGIGLGYPGQPHVVNRFMALRDDKSVQQAARIGIGWAVIVYTGMILLGLCSRILFPLTQDSEAVFFEAASQLFSPVMAGIMIAAVLSATMSTADSQLLVAGSSVSHDLPFFKQGHRLKVSRIVVFALSAAAAAAALLGSDQIFNKVLFAWTAMGAAFGPALLVRVLLGRMDSRFVFMSLVVGFSTGIWAYSDPSAKGTWLERVLPFLLSGIFAYLGYRRHIRDK